MKFIFFSSLTALFAQQITTETPLSAAYAFKDITISGLLLAAVVFLYRELGRARQKSEDVAASAKVFIEKQTEIMQETSKETSSAMNSITTALEELKDASREQIEIHRTHIKAIIENALRKGL